MWRKLCYRRQESSEIKKSSSFWSELPYNKLVLNVFCMNPESVNFVSDDVTSKFGLKKLDSCEEDDKICQQNDPNYHECCQRKETVF